MAPLADSVTLKLVFETSKKMFPAPSTLIRAVDVAELGTVTVCEPSFGTLLTSVIGNVFPPSLENRMLTLAVLMPFPVVPATFHVTVCEVPPAHETDVLGLVTVNADPVLTIVTRDSS